MLENALIRYCAPTLARLLPGGLFTLKIENLEEMVQRIRAVRAILRPKGVELTLLRVRGERALLYLYRPAELEKVLDGEAAQEMLVSLGYVCADVSATLRTLRVRLQSEEGFPHEIGIFLGYPPADVAGFIRNGGRDCLLCGCWKVYVDACKAARTFERLRKCKEVYARLFACGYPLSRLTVSADSA